MSLAFLALIVFAAYLGWRRGLFLMVLSLVGFAVGYAAALTLYKPFGDVIGAVFGLQPLLAYPIGGFAAFISAQLLFGIAAHLIKRRRRKKVRSGYSVGTLVDRGGGALLGATYGGGMALLIIWAMLFFQTLAPRRAPDVRNSFAGRVAAPLSTKLTRMVTAQVTGNDAIAGAAGNLVKDAGAVTSMTKVVGSKKLRALFDDPQVLRALATSDVDTAAKHPKLKALARDKELIRAARRAGLLSSRPEEATPAQIQREIAERVQPMAKAVIDLANDPEVRALLDDPALRKKLEHRRMLSLANDPTFNRLMRIVADKVGRAAKRKPKSQRSTKSNGEKD